MRIVEIENLTKRYGEVTAVDNVSFGIEEGENTPHLASLQKILIRLSFYKAAHRNYVRFCLHRY